MKVFFKDGFWIFDLGVIHGKRQRMRFDTYEQAKACLDRAGDTCNKSADQVDEEPVSAPSEISESSAGENGVQS